MMSRNPTQTFITRTTRLDKSRWHLRACLNNQILRAEVMVHRSHGWFEKEKRKDELTASLGSGGQF